MARASSPGGWLVRGSWLGTVGFVVVAVTAAVFSSVEGLFVIVSVGLFALGIVAFLAAYATAVARSRYDAMGIGGLFFLQNSAPRPIQWSMMGALAIQVVVAFAVASVRVFTPLAFGILVPMFGLGMAGLWGARHGEFDPRSS